MQPINPHPEESSAKTKSEAGIRVELINYTGKGSPQPSRAAAEILVFTKNTRLQMEPETMERVSKMSWPEIMAELDYMAGTIPSSWEFLDYTFLINNVTRAFTHQFVRTRTGSYAQQTMRVLDVKGWGYSKGPGIHKDVTANFLYEEAMASAAEAYDSLVALGVPIEDARGVLPTNIHTNIVAKFNLRTLAEMQTKRASSRTQSEYRTVLNLLREKVLNVHPWAHRFLADGFTEAAAGLEAYIHSNNDDPKKKLAAIKLLDRLRGNRS